MNEKSVEQLFKEAFIQAIARAVVYGTVLIVATVLCVGIVKREIKDGIEYGVQAALLHTSAVLLDDEIFNQVILPKIKQNVKEAIEYSVVRAKREWAASAPAKTAPKPTKP
ncbi:MAG: hypothetical protein ACKOCD_07090 [Nitrospiraceae bacterium]